jgi:putative Mn2+ efflux pump MntP
VGPPLVHRHRRRGSLGRHVAWFRGRDRLGCAGPGLSNFAIAIGIGLSGVDGRLRLRVALIFGFFEVAMPLVGPELGQRLGASVERWSAELGGVVLILVGLAIAGRIL